MKTLLSVFLSMFVLLSFNKSHAAVFRTCIQDFRPKGYKADGRIQGYSVDIIKALQELDKTIVFKGQDELCSISRIESDLKTGRLDVFISSFKTPERERNLFFVEVPIYIFRFMMVVRKDDAVKPKSFDDLRGKSDIILTLHRTALNTFLEKEPGLRIDATAETIGANLRKLESGRGRFFFVPHVGLQRILDEPQWKGKFKILPSVFGAQAQYVMVSRKLSTKNIELLQHALTSLRSSGKLREIFQTY